MMTRETKAEEILEGELIPFRADYERTAGKNGRPRLYETPDDFDAAVTDYYQYCRTHPPEPITLYGMILFMGFSGYECFYRYASYEGFSEAVKRAQSLVKYGYERNMLLTKNASAGRVLAAMDKVNFNPAVLEDQTVQFMKHEDRLAHLR